MIVLGRCNFHAETARFSPLGSPTGIGPGASKIGRAEVADKVKSGIIVKIGSSEGL
jgi:hypothetical protein